MESGGLDKPPQPEPAREASILPLPEGSAQKIITNLKIRGPKVFANEDDVIEQSNGILDRKLDAYVENDVLPGDRKDFVEGALATFGIVRYGALLNGKQLPEITEDQWDASEVSRAEKGTREDVSEEDATLLELEEIKLGDKEFGKVMDEYPTVMAEAPDMVEPLSEPFKRGVVRMYRPLKSAVEAEEMKKQFGV
jgi:hypothetical protein